MPSISVIEITKKAIRVGDEERPLRFADHVVDGWAFRDGQLEYEGRWRSQEWSALRIARWKRRVILAFMMRPLAYLRPKAEALRLRFEAEMDEYQEGIEEGLELVDVPREPPFYRIAVWFVRASTIPSDHTALILNCSVRGSI